MNTRLRWAGHCRRRLGGMGNGTPLPVVLPRSKTTGKRVRLPMPAWKGKSPGRRLMLRTRRNVLALGGPLTADLGQDDSVGVFAGDGQQALEGFLGGFVT